MHGLDDPSGGGLLALHNSHYITKVMDAHSVAKVPHMHCALHTVAMAMFDVACHRLADPDSHLMPLFLVPYPHPSSRSCDMLCYMQVRF